MNIHTAIHTTLSGTQTMNKSKITHLEYAHDQLHRLYGCEIEGVTISWKCARPTSKRWSRMMLQKLGNIIYFGHVGFQVEFLSIENGLSVKPF